jgi:hypothetical protein
LSQFADDDEADQPAHEFRHQFNELIAEFADAGHLLELRRFELEHQQRDDDREHGVAERLGAGEAKFATRKALQKLHPPSIIR